ncbi:anti-sigma factor [Actinokineospora sp. NPDC004072]
MTSADIHALTGAYALNAITGPERAAFERHLAECGACAQEVAELQATAARLGDAVAAAPPPAMKAAVLARIRTTRQLPPIGSDGAAAPAVRSPWPVRVLGLAAAVLLVVSVSLGVLLAQARSDLGETRAQTAAMTRILSAGDAEVISGSAGGLSGTVVYSRERGDLLLLADGVPAAPEGKTYQVWLMGGDTPFHSIGLVTPDSQGRAAILDTTGEVAGATNVGITIEPAGGSAEPSTEPIMEMDLT